MGQKRNHRENRKQFEINENKNTYIKTYECNERSAQEEIYT